MPAVKKLLAFDLGAESGRGLLGMFDGQRLRLEVVHRFPNGPVRTLETLFSDPREVEKWLRQMPLKEEEAAAVR